MAKKRKAGKAVEPWEVMCAVNRIGWLLERQVLAQEVIASLIKDTVGPLLALQVESAKIQVDAIRQATLPAHVVCKQLLDQ